MRNIRKQQDKERVFGFLKKYITLSMIMILLAISLVFFSIYRNLEISRITGTSIASLRQLSLSGDSLFDSIRKLSLQIYNDAEITSLVNDLTIDPTTYLKSSGRLNSFAASTINIISIYVYCRQTDSFYTTVSGAPRQNKTSFFDRDAVDFIDNAQEVRTMYPIPRKIKIFGSPDIPDNTVNAYTLVYYGMIEKNTGHFNRAVMINVSEKWFRNSLELWSKEIDGDLCILNEDGVLVSSLYNGSFMESIRSNEFADRILKAENKTGYFISNVSGVKSFVTYVYSDKLNWFFIRTIPFTGIYSNLGRIAAITCVLLLVYLAIGFFISYVITGKAKKSIDEIINRLKKEIQDNISDLEKLKEDFLYNCLHDGVQITDGSLKKEFEKYKIELSLNKALILVMLRIDSYNELRMKGTSSDIILLKQAIVKMALEAFRDKFTAEAVDMKNDQVIVILNNNGNTENAIFSQLTETIEKFQANVKKDLDISLSAAISSFKRTFREINLLYQEVRQASNYRVFYGHMSIVCYDEIKTLNSEGFQYPSDKEKMLLDALMLGKIDCAKKVFNEILCSASGYSHTVLNSLMPRLVSAISNIFEHIESNSFGSVNFNFNDFMSIINRCETMDEIKSSFYEMFDRVFSVLKQRSSSKYAQIVNRAVEIINNDYSNENLCLNFIADKLCLSPGYLGKLFKMHTSKSIGDYINQVRVEKALDILVKSQRPINEIAQKVGFSSSNYFYPVFKKLTGVTPAEYRLNKKSLLAEKTKQFNLSSNTLIQ